MSAHNEMLRCKDPLFGGQRNPHFVSKLAATSCFPKALRAHVLGDVMRSYGGTFL